MPSKRKGATAEDEIEALPAKITKGNKEVVEPQVRVWNNCWIYTRKEYNRRILEPLAGHTDMVPVPDNLCEFISKNENNLPGNLEEELEKHKQYVAIGYNYFYREEIAGGKMRARVTF